MATRIAFAGGESIVVAEDLSDVIAALEGHTADTPALPGFSGEDGQPVHVRPAAVTHVSAA